MRLKPSIFALLLVQLTLAYSLPVAAQGDEESGTHVLIAQVDESGGFRNDPDPTLSDPEARNNGKTPVAVGATAAKEIPRDSIVIKPVKPFTKPPEKDEAAEDPLSFNFLYYIIGKFKLSDIIE